MTSRVRQAAFLLGFLVIAAACLLAPRFLSTLTRGPDSPVRDKTTSTRAAVVYPQLLTDALARKVTVPSRPKRIVSLAPSLTETIFFLGAQNRLVGRTRYGKWPAAASDIPSIGGVADPSTEAILGTKADLILATTLTPLPVIHQLQAMHLNVAVFEQKGFNGTLADMRNIARLLGISNTAPIDHLEARRKAVRHALAGLSAKQRPTTLILYGLHGLYSAGPGTFPDDIVRAAGGRNAISGIASPWPQLSMEQVMQFNPDVIFVTYMDTNGLPPGRSAVKALPANPLWSRVKAVRDKRVYLVPDDLLSVPGPRMIDALEIVAHRLHPNRVPAPQRPAATQ